MKREQGTLIYWDDGKGFGFIRPSDGKQDIFLHVKSLPHYQRRPKIGDVLTYEVGVNKTQQTFASSAKIKGLAWSYFTFIWCCFTLAFGMYVFLVLQQRLSFHPLSIYAAMSLLTIWAYSRDKRAAQLGLWRESERKLHLLEAFGGWPGALLAQIFYRHKLRKTSFQIILWLIVAVHGALWYYVLTDQEVPIDRILAFIGGIK
jgi:uncharacterized membrane protein YsdA (DUF1294 family)/cold shock CspA family protein